jgi:hypothetical protein
MKGTKIVCAMASVSFGLGSLYFAGGNVANAKQDGAHHDSRLQTNATGVIAAVLLNSH